MRKRAEKRYVFTSLFEMSLLICMSFAVAFITSENFVSGVDDPTRIIAPETDAIEKAFENVLGPYGVPNPTSFLPTETIKGFFGSGTGAGSGGGAPNPTGTPYAYKGPMDIFGSGIENYALGNLVEGLVWSVAVVGIVQMVGGLFGADQNLLNTLSISAFGGIMTYKAVIGLFGNAVPGQAGSGGILGQVFTSTHAAVIGVGVAALIFVLMYKDTSTKTVLFTCMPYEPPLGGARCEECNKDPFRPCSEYRCKSLGQACELLNQGTSKEQCTWVSKFDTKSPVISPSTNVLYPKDLKYVPDTAIRPPALGVKIQKGSGCLQAYTPLQFGIKTDEPAQCKIDYNHTTKFDDMQFYFGESNYYEYNHTQKMRLPNTENETESPLFKNDGSFSLYVRCRDANGNENVDEYAISFCVDKSPDTTPPVIEGTSINNNAPVRYGSDNAFISLYTNEPSECKWSRTDQSYSDMENTMRCDANSQRVNANLQFTCSGNLTGIKNLAENKFYFRCKDQPGKSENIRNVNTASYPLTLRGSQELNIIKTEPNETIKGSTQTVPVELYVRTDDGADEGEAVCYFSNQNSNLDLFIPMIETANFEHKQPLDLINGSYVYYFRCIDAGGNTASSSTSFNVFVDKGAPVVARAYKDIDAMKIVTNEEAQCAYSLDNCNFAIDDGIAMLYSNADDKFVSVAEWKSNGIYYIKCRDLQGNEPSPNACSIVASAVQLAGKTTSSGINVI